MPKVNPPPSKELRSGDNIAGASVGVVLVKLAQNLPEDNIHKSWLIIIAPVLALVIRHLWNLLSPEIAFIIKARRVDKGRKKLIDKINDLLKDDGISEGRKAELRIQREQMKLSALETLQKRVEKMAV